MLWSTSFFRFSLLWIPIVSSRQARLHKHAVRSHAHKDKERPTTGCHGVTIGRKTIENQLRPTQPQDLPPSLSHKHLHVSVPPLFPLASFQLIAYSCQRWKTPELQPSWWNYSRDTHSTKVMWSLLSEAGEDSLCQSFFILLFTCFSFFFHLLHHFLLLSPALFLSVLRHLSVSAGVYATNVCLYLNHTAIWLVEISLTVQGWNKGKGPAKKQSDCLQKAVNICSKTNWLPSDFHFAPVSFQWSIKLSLPLRLG